MSRGVAQLWFVARRRARIVLFPALLAVIGVAGLVQTCQWHLHLEDRRHPSEEFEPFAAELQAFDVVYLVVAEPGFLSKQAQYTAAPAAILLRLFPLDPEVLAGLGAGGAILLHTEVDSVRKKARGEIDAYALEHGLKLKIDRRGPLTFIRTTVP